MKKMKVLKIITLSLISVLVLIIAGALIVMGVFLPKTSGDVYGNRLDGIENVPITDELKTNITQAIAATEKTDSSKVTLNGKILKITINVKEEVTLEDSKKIYDSFKEKFPENIKAFYDIEVIIINKNYSVFGYLKVGRTNLVWTNNK